MKQTEEETNRDFNSIQEFTTVNYLVSSSLYNS